MKNIVNKGFTLIELLIVIALLGVLATVVLIAVNPLQNLAKARDSGRSSTIAQLGHALEAYSTDNSGNYVTEGNTWITSLVTAGEITSIPGGVTYSVAGITACSNSNPQNGFCYDATTAAGGAPAVVYARLEATSNISKCAAGQWAYAVYSTANGRAGIVCRASGAGNEPVAGTQTYIP